MRALIAEAGLTPEAGFCRIVPANSSIPSGFCSTNHHRQVLQGAGEEQFLWCKTEALSMALQGVCISKQSAAECGCHLVTLLTPSWPGMERQKDPRPHSEGLEGAGGRPEARSSSPDLPLSPEVSLCSLLSGLQLLLLSVTWRGWTAWL